MACENGWGSEKEDAEAKSTHALNVAESDSQGQKCQMKEGFVTSFAYECMG